MKAVLLTEIGKLEVKEIPTPIPGKDEIVIKMLACGICGTDRHILLGEHPAAMPLVLGHEFGGEITAIGEGVEFRVGDLVSVDPNIICEKCDHCIAGRSAHCRNLAALGVTLNGGFAEYVLLPKSQAYLVPKNLNPLHLGLVEPLACCIRGMDLAQVKPGDRVAVLGGGSMGMLVVQLVKLAGASEIVLVTRQKERREVAMQLGATSTIDPVAEEVSNVLKDMDVTFEVAGVRQTFQQACAITRSGGTVLVLGVAPSHERVEFSVYDLLIRGLRIIGSYINPYTQGRAAELISSGKLNLDLLISRTISLDELPAVLAVSPGQGDIKYIVTGD
jgi:2-desacetyl-2-hydroxyethyl bacteriochlorophyllide A dehydrogenase